MKFIFIAAFLAGSFMGISQELFIHNEASSTMPKGVIGVRAFGESFKEVNTQRNMFALRTMYGLNSKLSLYLTLTGSNHHGKFLPGDFISHRHVGTRTIYYTRTIQKGLSYPYRFNGIHGYAKYRFFTRDGQNRHFRISMYAEASEVQNAHDEAEPNLLDDTKGWGGGFIASYLRKRTAVSFTTGVIVPGNYEQNVSTPFSVSPFTLTEIQYGRALVYNLSIGYLLYPKKYLDYSQTNWNVYLELNGKSYESARVSQQGEDLEIQNPALQAGNYVTVHPGIQKIVNSNLRIDFSAGFNLINKTYARNYPLFTVGLQRYFYPVR